MKAIEKVFADYPNYDSIDDLMKSCGLKDKEGLTNALYRLAEVQILVV